MNVPTRLSARRVFSFGRILVLTLVCAGAFLTRGTITASTQAPSADLAVIKTGPETAVADGQIVYQIVVTNGGNDDATNVQLIDKVPDNTTFVMATVSQGTVQFDGTFVTASFGTITAFESASMTLTVSVNTNTPPGTTITNTASATSSVFDPNTEDNSSTVNTTVLAPGSDLAVSKTGDDTAERGGQINYLISVFNNGPNDASNVTVSDNIPANTTFVNASVSQGTVMFNGMTVTADFGSIANQQAATLTLTVSVNFDTPRNTIIANTATSPVQMTDPDSSNNSATAFTQIIGPGPGDLIISEFRLRGPGLVNPNAPAKGARSVSKVKLVKPGGINLVEPDPTPSANDEFIEIYNNTNEAITISTADDSPGWAVAASDGVIRCTIPTGTSIPARGHFLCVNTLGYSLAAYPGGADSTATGDATYTLDIPDNTGIALFRTANTQSFTAAARMDAVGSTSEANTLYKEGNGYPALTTTLSSNHTFFRDLCGNGGSSISSGPCTQFTPKDTDNNAVDFIFADTEGTLTAAGRHLGAPGPENLLSPIQRNGSFTGSLLDTTKDHAAAPNRVRSFTSDPANNSTFGTLDIRRRVVNNTGAPVVRLRYRIVDMTTFPELLVTGLADLRGRTSPGVAVTGVQDATTCAAESGSPSPPCTVTVRGTILETPPAQLNGGALNSSFSDGLVTLQTPLQPGQSINVRFLYGIQATGAFRVLVNIEALNDTEVPSSPSSSIRRQ